VIKSIEKPAGPIAMVAVDADGGLGVVHLIIIGLVDHKPSWILLDCQQPEFKSAIVVDGLNDRHFGIIAGETDGLRNIRPADPQRGWDRWIDRVMAPR